MSNNNETNAFVKNVHLKGFKSIKDLEVRLNNGLNIIIGPNGSGKTNFVEAMGFALNYTATNDLIKNPYFFQLEFNGFSEKWLIEETFQGKLNSIPNNNEHLKLRKSKLILGDKIHEYDGSAASISVLMGTGLVGGGQILRLHTPSIITFNIPDKFTKYMLLELGDISIIFSMISFSNFNTLVGVFENNLFSDLFNDEDKGGDYILKNIGEYLEINHVLIDNLKKYSPINDLRLSPSVSINTSGEGININYLMLEFYVNNTWLTWKQLSDGTKRLFYIILNTLSDSGLVLIEEPENGVHPDQLYLLMDFFKEQSKHKQIILTTHAPEVLNVLYEDELDRIIVTRFDEKTGTQMHHLSEKQKKKGKAYMKNVGFLSMFWSNSSLEKYVAEEYE
jgi:predicted ATPase